MSAPPLAAPGRPFAEASAPAYDLAARAPGRRPTRSPHPSPQGHVFEVFVPCYRGGRAAGTVGRRVRPAVDARRRRPVVARGEAPRHAPRRRRRRARREVERRGAAARAQPPGAARSARPRAAAPRRVVRRRDAAPPERAHRRARVARRGAVLWNVWALRRHVRRRLATEEALRAEHAFRKAMEDSLHTGMRAVDLEGRVVYVNPAFCNMVGYTAARAHRARPAQPYWPPEERAQIDGALRAARAPGAPPAGIEMKLMRRGGERFDALLYEAPLIDAEGRQTGWMGSVLDITERKRARELARQQEEKLAATARLVTVGEMASTIAHELNQPLSAIASYTTGCLNLLEDGQVPRAELRGRAPEDRPAGAARRADHPARPRLRPQERAHAHARAHERRRRGGGGVRRRRGAQAPGAGAGATSPRRTPRSRRTPLLLQQVVLNLLRNAMDAMAATPPEQREIRVVTEAGPSSVTVSIADRGCGLSPEIRDHLFEPFFTTKTEGMGMGLNICRSIMELHRGRVWAEENPDGRHRLLVLAAARGLRARGPPRDGRGGERGVSDATVLVVDDDDAIRDALAWLFRSRGVPARTWPSAEAFLADHTDDDARVPRPRRAHGGDERGGAVRPAARDAAAGCRSSSSPATATSRSRSRRSRRARSTSSRSRSTTTTSSTGSWPRCGTTTSGGGSSRPTPPSRRGSRS